jgi:3-oxoacyl-(acyl-carrier-protein) reductase
MSTAIESRELFRHDRMEVISFEALKEKRALVTGASRGIGRAAAIALAEAGADVAVNFRSSLDAARDTCLEARGLGVRSRCYQGDVSNPEDVKHLIDAIEEDFGGIDILVNNAGITRDKSFRKMSNEMWSQVIETNLSGPAFVAQSVLGGMIDRGWGRIINVASIVGQTGNFGQANYAAAKGGLIAFTKSLARETARKGITVNSVAPGFIETDMTKDLPHEALQGVKVATPLGRLGRAEEVAAAIVFLALPAAGYITGEVISVNGGMYM